MLKPDQMQAAKSLLRMIESNPLDVSAYCMLASLYESSGEHQKANLTLRRVLEIDPFHQEAWLRLGIHHMNRGEWRTAADWANCVASFVVEKRGVAGVPKLAEVEKRWQSGTRIGERVRGS